MPKNPMRFGLYARSRRREKHTQGRICQGKPTPGTSAKAIHHCRSGHLITDCSPKTNRSSHMRRIVTIAALSILMLQSLHAATLDRVRETRVFRIGYGADAKPPSYRPEQGQPAGYVVDLCREVAAAVTQGVANAQVNYVLV